MKIIIYVIFCFGILMSCRKKCEQEILPDTIITPTFWNHLTEEMVISIKNNQKDTVINFEANIFKELVPNKSEYLYFDTLKYNNYETSILFSNNFLEQANNSIWQANSSIVGNVNYTDTTKAPLCDDASNLSLTTFSATTGIILNLNNIKNSIALDIELRYPYTYSAEFVSYDLKNTTSLNTTIFPQLWTVNINEIAIITLKFTNYRMVKINGITSSIAKVTTYKYISKRVQ